MTIVTLKNFSDALFALKYSIAYELIDPKY